MLLGVITSIQPTVRDALHRAGYIYTEQLEPVSPLQLARECGFTPEVAAIVLRTCVAEGQRPLEVVDAFDLWQREVDSNGDSHNKIPTFCRDVDEMLGGGFPTGHLSEVCGAPGVGKTQLLMQLAAAVMLPHAFGGLEGRCLFIDTEGSFVPSRFREMAGAAVAHVHTVSKRQEQREPECSDSAQKLRDSVSRYVLPTIMDGTLYHRAVQLVDLLALIEALPSIVSEANRQCSATPVRLVVVDSIAFPFRADVESDFQHRAAALFTCAHKLQQLAKDHSLAVVVSNHMTTREALVAGESQRHIIPALGDSWGHCISMRLILTIPPQAQVTSNATECCESTETNQEDARGTRLALLVKSPFQPRGKAFFRICAKGIRGAVKAGTKRRRDGDV